MRKFLIFLIVGAMLMLSVVPALAQDTDIVDIAVADGRFTTLVAAVDAAGLVDTLKGEGPFTVFAPTDDAFAAAFEALGIAPEDLLAEKGVAAGDEVDGTQFARNGCPSRGTVDIFIEPCMPSPQLVVMGTSPVAQALGTLAPQFHWSVSPTPGQNKQHQRCFVVVATQGQGDLDALKAALSAQPTYVAFVGSRRKYAALAEKMAAAGFEQSAIDRVQAPAGLDLGAVTPEEIALSILAQLVQNRRATVKQSDA